LGSDYAAIVLIETIARGRTKEYFSKISRHCDEQGVNQTEFVFNIGCLKVYSGRLLERFHMVL
jgi:hypothetical protein